jgi:hypothetical protein
MRESVGCDVLNLLPSAYRNNVKSVETGVAMSFSAPQKLRLNVCTKSALDNFDEAVLIRNVYNFYFTEKQRANL